MKNAVLASLALFVCGLLLGAVFPAYFSRSVGPVAVEMLSRANAVLTNNSLMLLFIFAKNVLVAVFLLGIGLLCGRAQESGAGWRGVLAGVGRFLTLFYPALVLVLNGAIIAWIAVSFYRAGIPVIALAGGLLPHGVIEIGAIVLCCGYAFAGQADLKARGFFFLRTIIPLLALSAAVEVYVSPVLMQKLL